MVLALLLQPLNQAQHIHNSQIAAVTVLYTADTALRTEFCQGVIVQAVL